MVGLGDAANIANRPSLHPELVVLGYQSRIVASQATHHYVRDFEGAVRRGQDVVRAAIQIREKGFVPDVVVAHPGWGEALFLRDVFPNARHICQCEYYYAGVGGDVGFDPDFPSTVDDQLRVRIKNATQLVSMVAMDQGVAPTRWQAERYPAEFKAKMHILHEGIDTEIVHPDKTAVFSHHGLLFSASDEVVTYVARNLEPYRGFHVFMRSLPKLQKTRPNLQVLIVGGDEVSYGKRLPQGQTYRAQYCDELKGDVDWSRVHFVGKLAYLDYLKVLQISSAHVYLTYPFVLSWSLLEAMAAGCAIVASATPPVQEVIEHGRQGVLVDFFDSAAVAAAIGEVLAVRESVASMRQAARDAVVKNYDLKRICLPAMLSFLKAN